MTLVASTMRISTSPTNVEYHQPPHQKQLPPESPRSVVGIDEVQQRQHAHRQVVLEGSTGGTAEEQHPTTTRKNENKKTVTFRLDESSMYGEDVGGDENSSSTGGGGGVFGKVKCDYYDGPPRPILTNQEHESLYWNKKHFKTWKKDCKNLASKTDEQKNRVYLETFLDAYSNPPAEETLVGNIDSRDTTTYLPLATASVRGLERFIFPGLLQDQSRVKESVLKAQHKLVTATTITPHQREFVLASTSSLLSRQSRHLARVIGHADSIVALSIYKSTFLPNKNKNKNSKDKNKNAKTLKTSNNSNKHHHQGTNGSNNKTSTNRSNDENKIEPKTSSLPPPTLTRVFSSPSSIEKDLNE